MCGIFGVIKPTGVPFKWVEHLGQLNTARGNIAFGGLVWSPERHQKFRFNHPFEAKKIPFFNEATGFLGHIRAPTGGHSDDLREVHPFETADIFLAHNGILLNHADFAGWRLMPDLDVDSQVIAGGVQHYLTGGNPLAESIVRTISKLDGQQGCWLWHKPGNRLYLWRVMSSLYYSHQAGCFIFSSVRCDLTNRLLPEGIVYALDTTAENFLAVADFEFYSPYKTTGE